MKAFVTLLFATALFCTPRAQAQTLIGVEAGGSLSTIVFETYDVELNNNTPSLVRTRDRKDLKFGPRVGLTLDIPFSFRTALQVGAQYAMKGFKYHDQVTINDIDHIMKQNYTFHYAEVPVNFVVRMGGGWAQREFHPTPVTHFILYGGPYLAYGFAGKGTDDSSFIGNNKALEYHYSHDIDFGNNPPTIDLNTFELKPGSEFQALDYGFQIGAGVELPFGLYAKAQYQQGLANLSLGAIDPITGFITTGYTKNQSFSLILGYWLNR